MSPKGTLLITGANGGIATGVISQFLKSPYVSQYKGYYTVRDPATATTLKKIVERPSHKAQSHDYEIGTLDMSTLESTRAGAEAINKRVSEGTLVPIRALILNAGVQDSKLNFTKDGIERVFAINYLHQFLLVLLLLKSMDKEHGRIVLISSTSTYLDWWVTAPNYKTEDQKIFFPNIEEVAKGKRPVDTDFDAALRRYAASKVFMIMFMFELQRRLDTDPTLKNISFLGLDPGWVSTSIARNSSMTIKTVMWSFKFLAPIFNLFVPNHFLRSAAKTGDDMLRVCFDNKFGEWPKAVYVDGSELGSKMNKEAKDEVKQKALWAGSLKYAGIKEGDTVLVDWK